MRPGGSNPGGSESPGLSSDPGAGGGDLEPRFPGVFSAPAPRSSAPPPTPDLLGGRYKVLDEIGRGGGGVVHKGLDTSNGETVAIKFVHDDDSQDGSALDRMIFEVSLLRKIEHPNICRPLCLQAHEGRPFLAMEILRGPSLGEHLQSQPGGRLPVEEVVRLLRPVAEALDLAHSRNVVHRDLKPGNLRFDKPVEEGGILKILDFGLAAPVKRRMARFEGGDRAGSPAYLAPEQARGADVKAPADLYALGVTAYEMLAGTPPFMGEKLDQLRQRGAPKPIGDLSGGVNAVLKKALAKSPRNRYPSASAMIQALEAARTNMWPAVLATLVLAALALVALRVLGGG